MNRSQKKKAEFRKSLKWKRFKKSMKRERKVDYITNYPLRAGWNLHHLDLNEKHYTDTSNRQHFMPLNRKTHDLLHFFYNYYKNDRSILIRLQYVLDAMIEINDNSDIGEKEDGQNQSIF